MSLYTLAIYLLITAEVISAIAGIWLWPKLKSTAIKSFVIYLCVTACFEIIGHLLHTKKLDIFNQTLMEYVAIPLGFIFFYWLISTQLNFKHSWLYFSAVYATLFLLDVFIFNKSVSVFFVVSYSAGTMLLIIELLIYFFKFILSDQILTYKSNCLFWVFTGLFCFQIATFPFYIMQNFLAVHFKHLITQLWYIVPMFITVMNIFFVVGLLCNRKVK
jgi:hypothetical protein